MTENNPDADDPIAVLSRRFPDNPDAVDETAPYFAYESELVRRNLSEVLDHDPELTASAVHTLMNYAALAEQTELIEECRELELALRSGEDQEPGVLHALARSVRRRLEEIRQRCLDYLRKRNEQLT